MLNRLLDELTEAGYQSDERFAESFVRSRIQRGQGPIRIAAELNQRGCSRELIDQYLHQVDHDWTALAVAALNKRFGFAPVGEPGGTQGNGQESIVRPTLGPRAFGKAGRFLASRGFPAALLHQLVERTYSDDLVISENEPEDNAFD